jgi:hypothetical protein
MPRQSRRVCADAHLAAAGDRRRVSCASAHWWFARSLEPPARPLLKVKAPCKIRPRPGPPLAAAYADYVTAHRDVVAFLHGSADLDLARIRFPNPFVPGIRFSLATDLHVIASHERRHLWQAWNVRRGAQANEPTAPDRLETQP